MNPPITNSEQLHVVERFTLDPNAMTLTREYTATDPVYYTDQYTGRDTIGVADLPYAPDACAELTFVDFSADGVAPDANSGGIGPQGPQGAAAAPAQTPRLPLRRRHRRRAGRRGRRARRVVGILEVVRLTHACRRTDERALGEHEQHALRGEPPCDDFHFSCDCWALP